MPNIEIDRNDTLKRRFLDMCDGFKDRMDLNSTFDNFLRLKILDIKIDIEKNVEQTELLETGLNFESINITNHKNDG